MATSVLFSGRRPVVTLSLSGSGHLLVYQLGVCGILLSEQQQQEQWNISNVVGASGGAIAATVVALSASTRQHSWLEDYAQTFIQQRGKGLQILQDLWKTAEESLAKDDQAMSYSTSMGLHIATTKCEDGTSKIFSFSTDNHSWNHSNNKTLLLDCLRASCCIPPSFHPLDLVSSPSPYPEHEGFPIHSDDIVGTQFYVDGGIATPAPLLDDDDVVENYKNHNDSSHTQPVRIIVSPIAGTSDHTFRISPDSVKPSSFYSLRVVPQIYLRHDMGCYLSWSNLKALQAASGNVSSAQLQTWYQRGQDDAHQFLESFVL